MRNNGFKVIVQDKNYSFIENFIFRQKLVDAYRLGVENSICDYIVIPFTPDNNMIPEKLPSLISKIKEGYDFVCVSRYKDGAKSLDDTALTAFGN